MMKNLHIILLISLSVFFPFLENRSVLGQDHQDHWCGKYPDEVFFNNKNILQDLHNFLSPRQINKIKSQLTVQTPIICHDNFLIIEGCKPHACPDENYILFMNLKEKKGYLCLWKKNGRAGNFRGTITVYGSNFSKPLLFKDAEEFFWNDFTKQALNDFMEDMALSINEESQKNAIRKLLKDGSKHNT